MILTLKQFVRPAGPGASGYDRTRSIHDVFAEVARSQPHAVAIRFPDRQIFYGELLARATRLALALSRRGVRPGDVVGLLMGRSPETIIAQLGILMAGGAYAPYDPAYPVEHLRYLIEDSAPRLILTVQGRTAQLARLPESVPVVELDKIVAEAGEAATPLPHIGGGDAAYVMYTSGSTGRPKGVVVTHRGVTRLVRQQNYLDLSPRDVVLHTATISFDASTFEVWSALLNGCRLAGVPDGRIALSQLRRTIESEQVSVMLLTTGLFHLLVDNDLDGLGSLRHVLWGGDVASAAHARRFLRAYPACRLTNAYGPTENSVIATTFTFPPEFDGDQVPIGASISHGSVHVLDADLQEVEDGQEGHMAVSGDGLAIGYLNRPELTAERFATITTREGRRVRAYLTGDMARVGEDGNLAFMGRRDRQVKIDGKRIELDEIEAALRRDERLADAAVVCGGEASARRIVAYLKPASGQVDRDAFAGAVIAGLRRSMPAHMIPAQTVVLESFPLNLAGKVDRARLPAPDFAPIADRAETASRLERSLAELWQRVLGIPEVSLTRNFFDMGGTSLQLMRIHATLQETVKPDLDVTYLFQHANIRDLARHLSGETQTAMAPGAAIKRAERSRQMLGQFARRRG